MQREAPAARPEGRRSKPGGGGRGLAGCHRDQAVSGDVAQLIVDAWKLLQLQEDDGEPARSRGLLRRVPDSPL